MHAIPPMRIGTSTPQRALTLGGRELDVLVVSAGDAHGQAELLDDRHVIGDLEVFGFDPRKTLTKDCRPDNLRRLDLPQRRAGGRANDERVAIHLLDRALNGHLSELVGE